MFKLILGCFYIQYINAYKGFPEYKKGCQDMSHVQNTPGFEDLKLPEQRPVNWQGDMKRQIRKFKKTIPLGEYRGKQKANLWRGFTHVKVDAKKRTAKATYRTYYLEDTLQKLMKEDPNFIQHDFEFIIAEEMGFDQDFIKAIAREVGFHYYNYKEEAQIKELQEKWLEIYSQTPFFHSSAVSSSLKGKNRVGQDKNRVIMERVYNIPDGYIDHNQSALWCEVSDEVLELRDRFPWEKRQNIAYFKGSSSGKNQEKFGYQIDWFGYHTNQPREVDPKDQLTIEKNHPTPQEVEQIIINEPEYWARAYAANFSYYNQDYLSANIWDNHAWLEPINQKIKEKEAQRLKEQNGSQGNETFCFMDCLFQPREVYFNHKYMLVLDGMVTPWMRQQWMMLGGFVILKQDSSLVQYFHEVYKPWVHYVPVKEDLSDLKEQIDWLRLNDDKAKEIANAGAKLAQYYMQPKLVKKFIKEMFQDYHDAYNRDILEKKDIIQ